MFSISPSAAFSQREGVAREATTNSNCASALMTLQRCEAFSWGPDGRNRSGSILGENQLFSGASVDITGSAWKSVLSKGCDARWSGGNSYLFCSCEVEYFSIVPDISGVSLVLVAMHSTGEPARWSVALQLAWKGSGPTR